MNRHFVNMNSQRQEALSVWSSSLLSHSGPLHFFTRRTGGVSLPPFHTLNLGLTTQDEPQNVRNNRKRIEEKFGLLLRALALQVHGGEVLVLKSAGELPSENALPKADAIVSSAPGISLAMFFADCVPLYLWDPVKKAGGLAHAGWRSTILDIGPHAIESLQQEFGTSLEDIQVAIGPSIGPCCFQVGPEVAEEFREKFGDEVIEKKDGQFYVDLWKSNKLALLKKGVKGGNIELAGECTSCRSDLYFSYRRDKGKTGRMAGVIQVPV